MKDAELRLKIREAIDDSGAMSFFERHPQSLDSLVDSLADIHNFAMTAEYARMKSMEMTIRSLQRRLCKTLE